MKTTFKVEIEIDFDPADFDSDTSKEDMIEAIQDEARYEIRKALGESFPEVGVDLIRE